MYSSTQNIVYTSTSYKLEIKNAGSYKNHDIKTKNKHKPFPDDSINF